MSKRMELSTVAQYRAVFDLAEFVRSLGGGIGVARNNLIGE